MIPTCNHYKTMTPKEERTINLLADNLEEAAKRLRILVLKNKTRHKKKQRNSGGETISTLSGFCANALNSNDIPF